MDDITIREALPEDYKRICDINRTALGYDYPEEKTLDNLKLILSMPADKIFVALYGSELAGYVQASGYECTYSDSLKNILALAVDEKYRGKGIGRRLLEEAEGWAKESGSSGVRLTSGFERKDAHEFYFRCGYKLRKDAKNFIKYFEA